MDTKVIIRSTSTEHRASSIGAALRFAMKGDLRWGREHRAPSDLRWGAICDERRWWRQRQASYGNDERAASDVTVGLVCSVLGFGLLYIGIGVWFALYWGLVCSVLGLGFGLLCIGVWFTLYWDWGLVCFVLGFGLLYEWRDRGFD